MTRSTERDGWSNSFETFLLTRFGPLWRLAQAIPPLKKFLNRVLIKRAILKTNTRPYQFSLKSSYTSWDSLTDRKYTGRHLPPAAAGYTEKLPAIEDVAELFRRTKETYRISKKSTVLFTNFAQWFTDGFLRTNREDSNQNTSNHEIDLCQIYGLNPTETQTLRELQGGRLKTSKLATGVYPPLFFDDSLQEKDEFKHLAFKPVVPKGLPPERKKYIFVGGVERINVTVGYAMLNTLFLREHNRVCGELQKAYPTWDDERLFQTARNVMIVVLLRIVIEDYINHITPYHFKFSAEPWGFEHESWYRTNWMTVEFNLLYRWHSMVPDAILVRDKFEPVTNGLFNNALLVENGLGVMFQSASRQKASEVGLRNTTNHLVREAELKAIELGRKANLRTYNDYRELFRFPRVTDWSQITGDEEVQEKLKNLYEEVDNLEFFVGLFAEDVRENSALSPLIGRMVGVDAFSQALTNPLLSLNSFKPETFSDVGWKIIQQTRTLQDVLKRNLGNDDFDGEIRFTQRGDEPDEPRDLGSDLGPTTRPDLGPTTRPPGFGGATESADGLESASTSAGFDEAELYKK
ncbi:peroxidase family protein [Anatilimnocola floriformis]|uniref:peroxidase family protein n=1 Tax=Anatilimnocola floriformis TaxID=2948575 RepID=UPI0020C527DC|nr:peroxidase family protein [Anatilimnocola floriformis]